MDDDLSLIQPVPLALLRLPQELDGSQGLNRAQTPGHIDACDDRQAIELFLQEYARSPGTHRVYRKECERLLLWSVIERRKPMSSLTREDFDAYLQFLAHPQPAERWCGPKKPRQSKDWRPFVGPLQEDAVLTAMAALNSLFQWLCDAGYLSGNPLGLVRQRRKKVLFQQASQPLERHLDSDMWDATVKAVDALPCSTVTEQAHQARLRFILALLYLLAPRAGELASHRMNSFYEARGQWWWAVLGKGQKAATVPLPDDMVTALIQYRQFLGLPAVPVSTDQTPLLMGLDDIVKGLSKGLSPQEAQKFYSQCTPLTARQLHRVLKELFSRACAYLPEDVQYKADKLRAASTHWGRHTSVTARVDAGMDPRYVQKDARHSDPRTTGLYTHEEDDKRHLEAQKLKLPRERR